MTERPVKEQIPGLWNIEDIEVFLDDEDRRAVVVVHAMYSVRVSRDDSSSPWKFFEEETPADLRSSVRMALAAVEKTIEEEDKGVDPE